MKNRSINKIIDIVIFGIIYLASIIIGLVNKTSINNYSLIIMSLFIFLLFRYIIKYIEKIKFAITNSYFNRIKIFLITLLIEFNILFLSLYFFKIFSIEKQAIIFIMFVIILLTILLSTFIIVKNINKNILTFRAAKEKDAEEVLRIYIDGAKSLKEDKVDQWQGEYFPKVQDITNHLGRDLFVLELSGKIIATACLIEGIDEDYERIDGNWNTLSPYISVHKFAVSKHFKGQQYSKKIIKFIELYAKNRKVNLRIDTHEDNFKMKNLLIDQKYKICGIVYISGKLKRIAYDKKIL